MRNARLSLICLALLGACAAPAPEAPPPAPSVPSAPAEPVAAPAVTVVAPPPAAAPAPPPPPPPPPTLPHAEALLSATTALFSKAQLDGVPKGAGERYVVLIDPLIDGQTRMQTRATQAMEARIAAQLKAAHPQFELRPMSAAALASAPLMVVGTFTPINAQGKTEGAREMYRFCLVLLDLRAAKVVSKTVARSSLQQVDHTPLPFFADAPAWTRDAPSEAYVRTCQASKLGDDLSPAYVQSLVAAAFVEEGVRAYNAARFKDAETLFQRALATPAGTQQRVLAGLYLAQQRQGRREAAASLAALLDYGLRQELLAMNFVFPPGATALPPDTARLPQGQWLRVLAQRLQEGRYCAEAQGHTSRSGPEPVNERLSALRAEHVRARLVAAQPELAKRLIAVGLGSRETLVGTGQDSAADQLDRRVAFKLLPCSA